MSPQRIIALASTALLLFPFIFLIYQFRLFSFPEAGEIFWAFKNSFIQSFFSALLSILLGFIGALGIVRLAQNKLRLLLEWICLIPNFVPPLFILLAVLNVLQPFPMGVWGIVLIHSFINIGLCAVILARAIENKAGGMIELGYIEGASRTRLFWAGVVPMLKSDIGRLFLFVFILSFASFSVPLIVGGGTGTTLEVLIYERIRLSADWGEAVFIAALQSLFIFGLSLLVMKSRIQGANRRIPALALGSWLGIIFIGILNSFLFYGYLKGVFAGFSNLATFSGMSQEILSAFLNSVWVGLLVGLFSLLGLLIFAFCWPLNWFEKFLNGYVAPSTALACFAFLVMGGSTVVVSYLKIPFVLFLLSITSLYRLGWSSHLESLRRQYVVAEAMGATHRETFKAVILPQLIDKVGLLAGIGAVWACGDFAVSRILAHRDFTIGMLTETLMSTYRLNQAATLSTLLILASGVCFLVFWGGCRVLSKKLNS